MPILGFIFACAVILASGLLGLSAVLNAPPPAQHSDRSITVPVTKEDLALRSKKDAEVMAERHAREADEERHARVAESLKNPIVVKRDTKEVDAPVRANNSQPTASANTSESTISGRSGFQTVSTADMSADDARTRSAPSESGMAPVTGRDAAPPPGNATADTASAKPEAAQNKVADMKPEPVTANAKPEPQKAKRKAAPRSASPTRQSTKRTTVAAKGRIPSKEELDRLIGFVPSAPRQIIVYQSLD